MGVAAQPVLATPDQFGRWLRVSWRRVTVFVTGTLVATVSATLSLIAKAKNAGLTHPVEWRHVFAISVFVQTGVIAVLLFFLLPRPITDKDRSPRASTVVRQFRHVWAFLVLTWLAEYIGLSTREAITWWWPDQDIFAAGKVIGEVAQATLDTLNNFTAAALALCYFVLSEQTVEQDHDGTWVARSLPWPQIAGLLALVSVVEFATRLIPLASQEPFPWVAGFGWTSGFLAGLGTAMVVGRLDSKLIGLRPWVLALLYLYAVIQAGWGGFQKDVILQFALLNLALVLKGLLFAVISWLTRSGVFLFYFERVARIFDEVGPDRREFVAAAQKSA